MYFDNAEGMVFRPPSEAKSLILRITIGCSHNQCTFCSMYKDVRFRIRPKEEIISLIQRAAHFHPYANRVFLADGNALALPTTQLLEIMELIRKSFPKLARITCYGGPKDILRKTLAELEALREAGLKIIYLGIESGDDEVLKAVCKGATAEEMIHAGKMVLAAGMKLSTMLILGLGGRARTEQHALNSARVVNAIQPTMLSVLTLMLHENSKLRHSADRGDFQPLSPAEMLRELKVMVENIDVTRPCIFRSNHSSNLFSLAGTLPTDKVQMVRDLEVVCERYKDAVVPTYNNTGRF